MYQLNIDLAYALIEQRIQRAKRHNRRKRLLRDLATQTPKVASNLDRAACHSKLECPVTEV